MLLTYGYCSFQLCNWNLCTRLLHWSLWIRHICLSTKSGVQYWGCSICMLCSGSSPLGVATIIPFICKVFLYCISKWMQLLGQTYANLCALWCLNIVTSMLLAFSSYSLSLWATLRPLILNHVVAGGAYCEESFIIHWHVLHGALHSFFSVFPVFTTRWVVVYTTNHITHVCLC